MVISWFLCVVLMSIYCMDNVNNATLFNCYTVYAINSCYLLVITSTKKGVIIQINDIQQLVFSIKYCTYTQLSVPLYILILKLYCYFYRQLILLLSGAFVIPACLARIFSGEAEATDTLSITVGDFQCVGSSGHNQ